MLIKIHRQIPSPKSVIKRELSRKVYVIFSVELGELSNFLLSNVYFFIYLHVFGSKWARFFFENGSHRSPREIVSKKVFLVKGKPQSVSNFLTLIPAFFKFEKNHKINIFRNSPFLYLHYSLLSFNS